MKVLYVGITFQFIFMLLMTFLNFARIYIIEHYSVYPIALFELFLGIASIVCGVYALMKRVKPILSFFVVMFGFFICFMFVFMYLLPEAGIPPAIPWLYPDM
ncbi:hypothetical protein LGQ02_01165 [Bacillus shivajii]|uniref:hypothetical protein n=1 Tax=Bacillus shivajii TaxID=1983719 RepID=UPI001CFA9C52|nr:hypothetical protein [Bacillus shivajii]UCZ53440.1 hypothetical protein LGQ02_01165 [Bacillus shivajii]